MSNIALSAPAKVNGRALLEELNAAGLGVSEVILSDDQVLLAGLTEDDRAAAEPIVAAHTGEPTAEQQAELDAQVEDTDRRDQLDQLRDKARAVWNGEDTFTQAQAQKILAGLVLLELRRR